MTSAKLAVVVGYHYDAEYLKFLEPLARTFDISVFTFCRESKIPAGMPFKFFFFDFSEDVPDYMANLEELLQPFDLVLTFDCSRLYSFQALRTCQKYGKPLVVYSNEQDSLAYRKHKNIAVVFGEVLRNSCLMISGNPKTTRTLVFEGVNPDSIVELPPLFDSSVRSFCAGKREKFRKYIGVSPTDRLILSTDSLENKGKLAEVMTGFGLLCEKLSGVKMLLVNSEIDSKAIHAASTAVGIAENVLVIRQDPEDFLGDLLSAADSYLSVEGRQDSDQQLIRFDGILAGAYGLSLAYSADHDNLAINCEGSHVIPRLLSTDIAFCLSDAVLEVSEEKRSERAAAFALNYSLVANSTSLEALATSLEHLLQSDAPSLKELANLRISETVAESMATELKRDVEEMLESSPDVPTKVKLWIAKGILMYKAGNFDSAGACFEQALLLNPDSPDAYKGLGFVAYRLTHNEEALQFFKRALQNRLNDTEVFYGLGNVYRQVGLFEESLYWLGKAVQADSKKVYCIAYIQACIISPDVKAAVRSLEQTLSIVEEQCLEVALGTLKTKARNLVPGVLGAMGFSA